MAAGFAVLVHVWLEKYYSISVWINLSIDACNKQK